jgi:hypothetical protein
MFTKLTDTSKASIFTVLVLCMSLGVALLIRFLELPQGPVMWTLWSFTPTVAALILLLVVTNDGYSKEGWKSLGLHRLGLETSPQCPGPIAGHGLAENPEPCPSNEATVREGHFGYAATRGWSFRGTRRRFGGRAPPYTGPPNRADQTPVVKATREPYPCLVVVSTVHKLRGGAERVDAGKGSA